MNLMNLQVARVEKNPVAMKSLSKKWHLKYFFFVFAPGLHEKYKKAGQNNVFIS